ncbi:acyltransferase family protein [Haloferula sp. BvORR071]|uniref:acyltransferase family protein n=1 Tax=Haloferula sp. BvORR071 TaxID=1396141 RepID=UPI000557CA86|nr:acyltransferase family protein [Haloferula sp. BvORR071]
MASSIAYRPTIDGLRAIAILAVFVFHLHGSWLPGGFVGVDVFFVLSGYLITSVIAAEHEKGSFSLRKFYQRRIARLLPAFLTMATATTVAAFFIYSPQDLASTGGNLAAAAASATNVKLMLQGTYFELSPDAEPFLHCWSLSVEEQFYLLYPLLLIFLRRRSRRMMIGVMAGLMLASLAACIAMTKLQASWAFYLLPTRAWELLAGGLFALLPGRESDKPRFKWTPQLGILLLLASFGLVREARGFPGYQALLPVIATLCVLAGTGPNGDSKLQRILASPVLVLVGKLSYSLYLWHWPVFSFVDYKFLMLGEWTRMIVKVAITFTAAALSYRLIESPLRVRLNRPAARLPAFGILAASLLICIPAGIAIQNANYINASNGSTGKLSFNQKQKTGSIVLMGDSHGSMYGQMVKQLSEELGYRLTVISVASGDALPLLPGPTPAGESQWTQSLETIQQDAPDFLILACSWQGKLDPKGQRLDQALEALRPLARKIILITQPPMLPPAATREAIRQGARPPFSEEQAKHTARLAANSRVLSKAGGNVAVIDCESLFHDSDGGIRYWDPQGHLLYHDRTHLSGYGAQQVKALLEKEIKSGS